MEPSDEVRELRRLRDAVDGVRSEAASLFFIWMTMIAVMILSAFAGAAAVDQLKRIADCQCSAMTAGTE